MSAFDRLQNYSSRRSNQTVIRNDKDSIFDISTIEGCFFDRIHNSGFDLYTYNYKYNNKTITEDEFQWLDDSEKEKYTKELVYTELYKMLKVTGNQVINAIAGSGKTTSLIFKIMHDIVTGEVMRLQSVPSGMQVRTVNKMWVCTFLRSGASELEKALIEQQNKYGYSDTSNQISFSTLDAEFKRCLNAMGVATPIGDSSTLNRLLKKAIDSCNITRGGQNLASEDYKIIGGILTYYRGRLDDKKYNHPSCADYGLTPNMLDLLAKQYVSLKSSNNIMDFEDITELLYKYLYETPNKHVQDYVANRYNFIYMDEFQDTSQMQYAIIKFYARGDLWLNRDGNVHDDNPLYTGEQTIGKIVVVGDVSQCIYSFKGSDSKILAHDFDADFRPVVSTLSYNWRCPKNILEPVVPSIHKNVDSAKQKILTNKTGGILNAYMFGSYQSMMKQLRQDLIQDMKEGNSVAILCRTNFDGMIPAFILEAENTFNFSISSDSMTLSSPLPKKILGVSSLLTERSSNTVKQSLDMFVSLQGKWQVRELIDVLRTNSMSIWSIPESDLKYSCPELFEFITSAKTILYPNGGKKTNKSELMTLEFIYNYLRFNVFNGRSAYAESARAYIDTILYVLNSKPFDTIYDFIEEIEFLDEKLHARIKKNNTTIRVATVHEFKGKECDSVYIWNDSMGTFPSSKTDLNNLEQVEEERRVHYIACTRAKKKETIYCMQDKVGMFLEEMDVKLINPIPTTVSFKKQDIESDSGGNASITNDFINNENQNIDSEQVAFVSIAEE